MIEKNGAQSQSVLYIYNISVLGRTDFEHPIFSSTSSQNCSIEVDLEQKMSLLLRHEKNVIYSKLLNNPFFKLINPTTTDSKLAI